MLGQISVLFTSALWSRLSEIYLFVPCVADLELDLILFESFLFDSRAHVLFLDECILHIRFI